MNRSKLIEELLSVKNYKFEYLTSKTYTQLKGMRDGKMIKKSIEKRKEFEEKLNNLDPETFNDKILKTYDYDKIKELHKDFILRNKERIDYINYVCQRSNLSKERLSRWSTTRLKIKTEYLKELENKKNTMNSLKEYGDSITVLSTPLYIQKQRLNFLLAKGSKDNAKERLSIVKKTVYILKKEGKKSIYKTLMTEDINILKNNLTVLQKQYNRNSLITYLLEHNYDIEFLNKQKLYVLEYLKSDLQPCERGSRTELIRSLAKKNIWSRNTIRNWDIERLKSAYIKNAQDNYSPLSEYVPNRPLSKSEKEKYKEEPHPRLSISREQILKDLSETIYFDIVTGD